MVSTYDNEHKYTSSKKKKSRRGSDNVDNSEVGNGRVGVGSNGGRGGHKNSDRSEETYLNMHYDLPRSVFQGRVEKVAGKHDDDHVYEVVGQQVYENIECHNSSLYENVVRQDVTYDRPRGAAVFMQSHYENMTFDECDEDHTYLNVNVSKQVQRKASDGHHGSTYDVPRSASSIYDHPISKSPRQNGDQLYDSPKSLVPLSAQLLLNARNNQTNSDDHEDNNDVDRDCDVDSLDGSDPIPGTVMFCSL